jgi:hypothetical protein
MLPKVPSPAGAATPRNSLAVIGFGVSVVAAIAMLPGQSNALAIVASGLGLGLSGASLNVALDAPCGRRGVAIAGIVLGLLALAAGIAVYPGR